MKTLTLGKRVVPIWFVAVLIVSVVGSTVLGYVAWTTLNIPVEVKEPIKILDYPTMLSLFPGDTEQFTVSLENQASNDYTIFLEFSLHDSQYQSNYVTFSDKVYTLQPGQHELSAWFAVKSTAPAVNTTLTVSFSRVESTPLPSGLMAYWKLDEGAGTTVSDSSGNNYQGTIQGANWIDGKFNKALNFDGVSSYVNIPSLPVTDINSLTVVVWINSDFSKIGYIFYHGDTGEFLLHNGERTSDGPVAGRYPNIASFSVKLAGSTWYDVYSKSLEPSIWHQLVGVWTKGESLKIYVDGTLAGENNAISSGTLLNDGSYWLPSLGVYNRGAEADTFYKGLLDNVMVFNRALTSEEITTLYANP
jgi:hypothetical protein